MIFDIYFDNFIICLEKEVVDYWVVDGWRWKIMIVNVNKFGVLKQLMVVVEGYLWFWLIYFVIVGVLIVLIILFCWLRKVKKKYKDIEYKKIDICIL